MSSSHQDSLESLLEVSRAISSKLDLGDVLRTVLELASGREKAKRMGAAGRRRVEEEYSLNRCLTAYRMLYQSLIAGEVGALADILQQSESAD